MGGPVHPERVEEDFHVGELVVVAVVSHQFGATPPEIFRIDPERWKDCLVLHVAWTERLVVIVNDRDDVLRRGHCLSDLANDCRDAKRNRRTILHNTRRAPGGIGPRGRRDNRGAAPARSRHRSRTRLRPRDRRRVYPAPDDASCSLFRGDGLRNGPSATAEYCVPSFPARYVREYPAATCRQARR